MKTSHIIGLIIIAFAIGIIISTVGDASTYVGFAEAEKMRNEGSNKAVHVVGSLKKDAQGNFEGMIYEPTINPNRFEFVMTDSLHRTERVVYSQPKPADIDKSEKVVVIGKMKEGFFAADQILLKCPSKYENKEVLK